MDIYESSPYFNPVKTKVVLHDTIKEAESEFVNRNRNDFAYILKVENAHAFLADFYRR